MAHTRSAKKRVRATQRRTARNKAMRSRYRTYVRKANELIESGDLDAAKEAVTEAISVLDKTARKRVIHPNGAARRKSKLARKLNAALAETA